MIKIKRHAIFTVDISIIVLLFTFLSISLTTNAAVYFSEDSIIQLKQAKKATPSGEFYVPTCRIIDDSPLQKTTVEIGYNNGVVSVMGMTSPKKMGLQLDYKQEHFITSIKKHQIEDFKSFLKQGYEEYQKLSGNKSNQAVVLGTFEFNSNDVLELYSLQGILFGNWKQKSGSSGAILTPLDSNNIKSEYFGGFDFFKFNCFEIPSTFL